MIITYDVSSCPDCGEKPELDEKRAELFCKQCGLVIHESLFSTDVRFHLAESILYSPKSRRIHLVMRTSEEKVLKGLYHETEIVNATLGAPAWFVKDVMQVYMKLYKKGARGPWDRLALIGGVFSLLSRREGLPYSNEDIAFASFTTVRKVLDSAKFVSRELKTPLRQLQASNFVYMKGYELGVEERTITVAGAICDELESNRSYKVILGLAYLIAADVCGAKVSKRRVAKVCGTTVQTLNALAKTVRIKDFKRYAELYSL